MFMYRLTISGGFRKGFLGIFNPQDGDFSLWERSKNPREVEIPGIGIGDFESPKIPSEKSPILEMRIRDFWGWKIPDKNPQSRGWGFGIFESEKSPIVNPQVCPIPGMGIYKARGYPRSPIPNCFRWMGYPDKKLPLVTYLIIFSRSNDHQIMSESWRIIDLNSWSCNKAINGTFEVEKF